MYKLLIADDEYWIRERLSKTISWLDLGITSVFVADNGEAALDIALQEEPDIIITDIKMPLLSGLELMQTLNESGLYPKIIAISGYDDFEYVQKALRFHVKDYILKPVDENELLEKVQDCIDEITREASYKNLLSIAEEALSRLQDDLFLALITDGFSSEQEFEEQFLRLGLSIPYSGATCFSIVLPESSRKNSVFSRLHKIISAALISVFDCFHVFIHNDIITGIVFSNTPLTEPRSSIYYVCNEILSDIITNSDISASIGIGSYSKNRMNCCISYQQSLKAADFYKERGMNDVYLFKPTEEKTHWLIKDIQQFIQENYNQKLTLSFISSHFYLNASYFSKLFKQETGSTFTSYLATVRIAEAKKILKDPSMKIYDVAAAVGYDNEQYFSTIFKNLTGESPSQYKSRL